MSRLMFLVIEQCLKTIELDFANCQMMYNNDDPLYILDYDSKKQPVEFPHFFKNIWANNGD